MWLNYGFGDVFVDCLFEMLVVEFLVVLLFCFVVR